MTIDELSNIDDIDLIKKEISEKLSILNLQRYITQDIPHPNGKIQQLLLVLHKGLPLQLQLH